MMAVRVSRHGDLKEVELVGEVADYYKLCGFRNAARFEMQHEWTVNGTTVRLFAKMSGKANTENKYEFPPPVDETLFFGKCLLVSDSGLTKNQWTKMYAELMGGFESLEEEDESAEEDAAAELTKEGYCKDDFVVSDSEAELDFEPYMAKLKLA
jgi:hypothetical protein